MHKSQKRSSYSRIRTVPQFRHFIPKQISKQQLNNHNIT